MTNCEIEMHALIAEREAYIALRESMVWENAFRLQQNLPQAYPDSSFTHVERELLAVAQKMRNLKGGAVWS